jgi:hypothetical protein
MASPFIFALEAHENLFCQTFFMEKEAKAKEEAVLLESLPNGA